MVAMDCQHLMMCKVNGYHNFLNLLGGVHLNNDRRWWALGLGRSTLKRQRRAGYVKVAQRAVFDCQTCLIKDLSMQVLLRDPSSSYFV